MKYFMVLTAKEMLFSTDILFSQFIWFKDSIFSRRFCKIQGHFGVFYNTWEPRLFVKPYGCSIFYFSDFHLYPFKTSSTFNPNITTTCSAAIFERK